jgi:hypothetical protein
MAASTVTPPPGFELEQSEQQQDQQPTPPPGFELEQPDTAPPAPVPSNVYQAAPDEQTDEGHAAAVARREKEHPIVTAMGKGAGEVLGDVGDALNPVNIAKGIWHSFPPVKAYESIQNAVPIIKAYESARGAGKSIPEALSVANEMAKQRDATHQMLQERAEDFKKAPGQATVRALGDAAVLASTFFEGPEAFASETGGGAGVEAAATPKPGLARQIMEGEKVAQPQARAAVRSAVPKASEGPMVEGHTTVLDEHLSELAQNEKAAYKQLDDAAGFDLKAEKAQLANDKYKLKQLGNTDADINQRGNLTESINDSMDRIAQAEAKMKEAGIDPKAGDVIHQQRMAGQEFKKSLVKNTDASTGDLNVKGLLKDAKAARFSKYGDRLEQYFGSKKAADEYVSQLKKADQLGMHAIDAQKAAKWVGGVLGLGGAEEVIRRTLF